MSERQLAAQILPKRRGVVHARREHVHRLHEAKIIRNPVNRGVIGGGQAGNHRRVFHRREPAQHARPGRRARSWRRSRRCAPVASISPAKCPGRLGPFAGAGTNVLFAQNIAGARAPHVANAMPQTAVTAPSRGGVWQNQFSWRDSLQDVRLLVAASRQSAAFFTKAKCAAFCRKPLRWSWRGFFMSSAKAVFSPPRPACGCCRSGR